MGDDPLFVRNSEMGSPRAISIVASAETKHRSVSAGVQAMASMLSSKAMSSDSATNCLPQCLDDELQARVMPDPVAAEQTPQ
ncbi:hypothetical protein [Hoeflea halophila]|uniref:hypothetical protein n=1 Tax=Hoeflea halophila TaxID=714899 RepID=UPI00117A1797|nr:hypothetical protein [Hoeflea halophila]